MLWVLWLQSLHPDPKENNNFGSIHYVVGFCKCIAVKFSGSKGQLAREEVE